MTPHRRRRQLRICAALLAPLALLVASCTVEVGADESPATEVPHGAPASPDTSTTSATTSATTSVPTTTTLPPTTTSTTTTTTTTTTTSTTTSTSTTTTTTSTVPVPVPDDPPVFDATRAAYRQIADRNTAASLSVWRDGHPVLGLATGSDRSGEPVTTATPMVVASVSKLITALTIARLVQAGTLDVGQAVPWEAMGLTTDPAWHDVTLRELLDHTSGMPVARQSWLDDPGTCSEPLAALLADSPTGDRGRWVYSNGNYCALGLVVEAVTGERYDDAARRLVFEPAGVGDGDGPHLTIDGPHPNAGPYDGDLARFDRLGGAGSWLAGSDHVAAVLATVSVTDRLTMHWPGIFLDAYGWGHTGTVKGAKACAWVLEDGRTVVVAVVAGERPSTGGGICDVILPALGADLGLVGADGEPLGEPDRSPR